MDLHVTTIGSGPDVVLLHGGPGLDHTYFRPWLDTLADACRLTFVDLSGNGRSPQPDDWSRMDHGSWVADVERVRRHLGAERITLFGHSYGGYIALEYALAHPDRLAGLVLCDTAPAADYGSETYANAVARGTPEQVDVVANGFTRPVTEDPAVFSTMYHTILPLYFHGPVPDAARDAFRRSVYRPTAFNHMFFTCRPAFDVTARLPEIRTPALVLHGRHDWVTPPGPGGDRLHAGLPSSELVVFEKSGHFPFMEENHRFIDVFRDWLERLYVPVTQSAP